MFSLVDGPYVFDLNHSQQQESCSHSYIAIKTGVKSAIHIYI